jgi:hypothetical protein
VIWIRSRGGTGEYQPMYWVFSGIRRFEYFIESSRLIYSIFAENLEVIVRYKARAGQAFMNDFQQTGEFGVLNNKWAYVLLLCRAQWNHLDRHSNIRNRSIHA